MMCCWRKVRRPAHSRRAANNPEVALIPLENAIEPSPSDLLPTVASPAQKMHINDLPVEILSEIFEFAVVREYPTERNFVPVLQYFGRRAAPVNLIHVCQHWRSIAFWMSSLWTSLSSQQDARVGRAPLRGMSYWLNCSRTAPLNLHLLAGPWLRGKPDLSIRPMLQIFSQHMHRWKSFSIVVNSTELLQDLVCFLGSKDLPLLTALEIELLASVPQDLVDKLANIVRHLENLRWVYWSDWERGRKLPELSWSEYDKIHVETPFAVEESIALLAQCTTATCVTLLGSGGRRPSRHNSAITLESQYTLHNLTRLALEPASEPLVFLQYFTLPSLRYLELRLEQRDFDPLEDFLRNSQCALQELTIIINTSTAMQAKDVADFFNLSWLQTIPNVRLCPTGDILRFLQEFELEEICLPSLTVWMDKSFHLPFFRFVGWKNGDIVDPLWSYEAGSVIYHPMSKFPPPEYVFAFL